MAEQDKSEPEENEDDDCTRSGVKEDTRTKDPAENRGRGSFESDDEPGWAHKPSIEPPDKWR